MRGTNASMGSPKDDDALHGFGLETWGCLFEVVSCEVKDDSDGSLESLCDEIENIKHFEGDEKVRIVYKLEGTRYDKF